MTRKPHLQELKQTPKKANARSFKAEKESSTRQTLHAAVSTQKGANGELFLAEIVPQDSDSVKDSDKNNVNPDIVHSYKRTSREDDFDGFDIDNGDVDNTSHTQYNEENKLNGGDSDVEQKGQFPGMVDRRALSPAGRSGNDIWEQSNDPESVYERLAHREDSIRSNEETGTGSSGFLEKRAGYSLPNGSRSLFRSLREEPLSGKDRFGRAIPEEIAKKFSNTLRKFDHSMVGEAIVEVNNEPNRGQGIDNVLVFLVGTKKKFYISRVVRCDARTESEMEIFREVLYEGRTWSDYYCAFLYEEGLAREYRKADFGSFEQYQQEVRRSSFGQEGR